MGLGSGGRLKTKSRGSTEQCGSGVARLELALILWTRSLLLREFIRAPSMGPGTFLFHEPPSRGPKHQGSMALCGFYMGL